ncbi:MAG: hypothetical protein WD342_07310 [Verrucomicrobiales bacterium]
MDKTGLVLDGYRLVRPLGRGGFGEVWLCRSQAMGDLRAIKLVSTDDPQKVSLEHAAMLKYRAAAGLDPRYLVPIEHINRNEGALYYVMPLADGTEETDPESVSWKPLTLEAKIEARRGESLWFSSREIIGMISPVLLALQTLLAARLVHGDVKPSNVLFFNGAPRLADLGLLDEDGSSLPGAGTPGFSAPSWYSGGLPDMYSVAASLHALLTGNDPDTMGRSAFRWPPQGEESLSESERREWRRLHDIVRRAGEERVSERYRDFSTMLDAVRGAPSAAVSAAPPGHSGGRKQKWRLKTAAVLALLGGAVATMFGVSASKETTVLPEGSDVGRERELTDEEEADYRALAAMIAGYDRDGAPEKTLSMVEALWNTYPRSRAHPVYSIYRAKALRDLGRTEEAREELRKPVQVSPKIAEMPVRIELWESLGDPEGAELSQTRILDAYGPNTMALAFRAEVRAKRGDFDGVEADRLAALPLNPDESETQKKLVATLWDGLAEKHPGYAKHVAETAPAEGEAVPAHPQAVRDERWVIESFDDILDDLLAQDDALSDDANAARRQLRSRMIEDFQRGHYEYSLAMLDRLTAPEPGYRPIPSLRVKTCVLSLYRALLLERLGRQEEAESELRSPVHNDLGLRKVESRIALLDALDREDAAEELLARMMEALLSGPGGGTEERIALLGLRARVRAGEGRYVGASEDYEAASRLAAVLDSRAGSSDGSRTARQTVEGIWLDLEEHFPGYAADRESRAAE